MVTGVAISALHTLSAYASSPGRVLCLQYISLNPSSSSTCYSLMDLPFLQLQNKGALTVTGKCVEREKPLVLLRQEVWKALLANSAPQQCLVSVTVICKWQQKYILLST